MNSRRNATPSVRVNVTTQVETGSVGRASARPKDFSFFTELLLFHLSSCRRAGSRDHSRPSDWQWRDRRDSGTDRKEPGVEPAAVVQSPGRALAMVSRFGPTQRHGGSDTDAQTSGPRTHCAYPYPTPAMPESPHMNLRNLRRPSVTISTGTAACAGFLLQLSRAFPIILPVKPMKQVPQTFASPLPEAPRFAHGSKSIPPLPPD